MKDRELVRTINLFYSIADEWSISEYTRNHWYTLGGIKNSRPRPVPIDINYPCQRPVWVPSFLGGCVIFEKHEIWQGEKRL